MLLVLYALNHQEACSARHNAPLHPTHMPKPPKPQPPTCNEGATMGCTEGQSGRGGWVQGMRSRCPRAAEAGGTYHRGRHVGVVLDDSPGGRPAPK